MTLNIPIERSCEQHSIASPSVDEFRRKRSEGKKKKRADASRNSPGK